MSRIVEKIPNFLTFLRLLLIPVFVALMSGEPSRAMVFSATVIFVIAALTDYVDGMIARRYGAISDFGKLLDPLADKILVMAALVMLVAQRSDLDGLPWVPGWMVVLVLAREIWITGLRGIAATHGVVLAASGAGKLKSGLQMVAVVLLLLHDYPLEAGGVLRVSCQTLGLNLLLLSIIVSIWGAAEYTVDVLSRTSTLTEEPSSGPSAAVTGSSDQESRERIDPVRIEH